MFDSVSDSDLNTSVNTTTLDSATEAQILAETRGEQLQEEVISLTKELNNLRAQFDQAMKLSEGMNEIHEENNKLKTQVRELNNEKQDLLRRIEISTKAREEVMKKLEEERKTVSTQREADSQIMSKELEKTKKAFKSQIDSLTEQLQNLQAIKDQDDISQKTLVSRIETMVENASHYLNITFQSFDELCDYLEQQASQGFVVQPPQETQKIEPLVISQPKDGKMKEYEKKIKIFKTQLKLEMARNKDLEDKLHLSEKSIQNLNATHEAELDAVNAQIAHLNEEHAIAIDELKHQISVLESKLNAATKEKKKKAAKQQQQPTATRVHFSGIPQPPQQIPQMPQPQYVYNPPQNQQQPQQRQTTTQNRDIEIKDNTQNNKDNELINEQYIDRINELSKQVETITKKYSDACNHIKQSEARCGELLVTLDKTTNELQALKTVHNETVAEVETIRKALHAKDDRKDKKQERMQKKEQQKQKASLINLEKKVELLKQQNYEQQLEKESIAHTNKEQATKIKTLEQEIADLKADKAQMQSELTESLQKLNTKKTLTEEDFIPQAAWSCGEFEPQLSQEIEKIGQNSSLAASSKIQHIYKTINKYYDSKIKQTQTALDDNFANTQKLQANMNDFLVSLTITLSDQAVTLEQFLNEGLGQEIITTAANLRSSLSDARRQAECLQAIVDTFTAHFGTNDCGDVIAQIQAVRNQLEQKQAKLSIRNKQCRALKEELGETVQKLTTLEVTSKQTEEELKDKVLSLTKTNTEHQTTITKLKTELKQVKDSLAETSSKLETIEQEYSEQAEEYNNEKAAIVAELEAQHQEIENNLKNQIDSLNATLAENEQQITRFKKAICLQKTAIAERDNQIQQLKEENESNIESLTTRSEIEKKQLIESYENAVKEITDQCNAHRSDVEKLSAELAKNEKRVKEAKVAVLKSRREQTRLEKENKAMEEQIAREKKLNENALKNALISAQTTFNSKINDVKTKADDEKRKLIAIAATEFSQFFDASETIDERSFKALIVHAKDELERLTKSDNAIRRMINITGKQTTDDAVAQLLMESN